MRLQYDFLWNLCNRNECWLVMLIGCRSRRGNALFELSKTSIRYMSTLTHAHTNYLYMLLHRPQKTNQYVKEKKRILKNQDLLGTRVNHSALVVTSSDTQVYSYLAYSGIFFIDILWYIRYWHTLVYSLLTYSGIFFTDILWYILYWHTLVYSLLTYSGIFFIDILWYILYWYTLVYSLLIYSGIFLFGNKSVWIVHPTIIEHTL